MKNLTEFKALIIRYETITIEEIEKKNCIKQDITGFGRFDKCTLCIAIGKHWDNNKCHNCLYYSSVKKSTEKYPCNSFENEKSYERIYDATTPNSILKAYWLRAIHMRGILKKLNIEF